MLGSLAKIIGLSVASLGSFNMPTRTNENWTYDTINVSAQYQFHSEQNQYIPTTPQMPATNCILRTNRYYGNSYDIYCNKLQNVYYSGIRDTTPQTWEYQANYQNEPMSFYMETYYIKTPTGMVNQFNKTNLYLNTNGIFNGKKVNVDFYTYSGELPQAKTSLFTDSAWALGYDSTYYQSFNRGKRILNKILYDNQIIWYHKFVGEYTITDYYKEILQLNLDMPQGNNTPIYAVILVSAKDSTLTATGNSNPTTPTSIPQMWMQNNNQELQLKSRVLDGTINYEVVDVPGLCFDILTMPFTFISIAFNLTLFPGTPYQLNISWLFLTILGIMIFIWLITLLLGKFK